MALQELDDSELDSVAGGDWTDGEDECGHDSSCITLWHCYSVTLHTSSETMHVKCWTDWICLSNHWRSGS